MLVILRKHQKNVKRRIYINQKVILVVIIFIYLFKKALRKYGEENFKWEVIIQCSSLTECQEKEKYYIKKYNTISPYGYNLTEGGNGGIHYFLE